MFHTKFFALIFGAVLITGCSEPTTGAYEATMVSPNGETRLMGIAILKEDQIIADGQSVKVARWVEEEEVLTAFADDDSQIFQLERTAEGEYKQAIPSGTLVFKKYDLPTLPTTW